MDLENRTLGSLLSDPRIAPAAPNAIRAWDLSKEDVWNKTLRQIKEEHIFAGDLALGFDRLLSAADTGDWAYPLYTPAECAEDPAVDGTNLIRLPSDDPAADGRPFILLVPGGGFVNVWNLTEGWPIAAQFNRLGYHVFILTYRVDAKEKLLEKNMQDFARALEIIRNSADRFRVRADKYITCGFSAGGYLVCLWNTSMGYPAHGLPKPQAVFPVYPVTSLKEQIRYGDTDPAWSLRLYGCSLAEATQTEYDIPEHVELFPPCAIFLTAQDELVDPENSKLLYAALQKVRIPCHMEIGPTGGHGFADGEGMCMAGWTGRAVKWFEGLE